MRNIKMHLIMDRMRRTAGLNHYTGAYLVESRHTRKGIGHMRYVP